MIFYVYKEISFIMTSSNILNLNINKSKVVYSIFLPHIINHQDYWQYSVFNLRIDFKSLNNNNFALGVTISSASG